jgi:SAM-dependent methyltransferase
MAQALATSSKVRSLYITRHNCRACGSKQLEKIWSFSQTPLANAYREPNYSGDEPLIPLEVFRCEDCQLVQLRDIVDAGELFRNYLYVSSTSPSFVAHFKEYADTLIKRFRLTNQDLIIDVGSNDGVLLKPLQQAGVQILGIDPAENVAAFANAAGIRTMPVFFTPEIAADIAHDIGYATVVTANNVFAHTDDIASFTTAVRKVLAGRGAFVFEVQYLADLIQENLFDIVYHEHLCYYHLTPLIEFFARHNMEVFDAQHVPVHGGSIRVFVQHKGGPHQKSKRLSVMTGKEIKQGLGKLVTYRNFAERIKHNKLNLQKIISRIKADGKRIVGYGAPAKATTLCYAFGLDNSTLDYIVDDDAKIKQGLVMPGTHIPIVSPDKLYTDKPDYCLILAWNFAQPIMNNHQTFKKQGGKFIVPVPEPKII